MHLYFEIKGAVSLLRVLFDVPKNHSIPHLSLDYSDKKYNYNHYNTHRLRNIHNIASNSVISCNCTDESINYLSTGNTLQESQGNTVVQLH